MIVIVARGRGCANFLKNRKRPSGLALLPDPLNCGGGAEKMTRRLIFPLRSRSFSTACREGSRPGGSLDAYVYDAPWLTFPPYDR
jgi:hypothetical protein